ncbi:MAG TPA: hypothetical protein ENI94_02245 [Gammaproteobacteria bacterium]|nr:hypothetical protein [Gammaproteobacteria bacterium]
MDKEPFKLVVDPSGNAMLSGKAGIVVFNGSPVLEKLGVAVKFVNVQFGQSDDGEISYTGTFEVGAYAVSISGYVDVEKLILGCTGLLCVAARAVKNRTTL